LASKRLQEVLALVRLARALVVNVGWLTIDKLCQCYVHNSKDLPPGL
jgi:hydroxyethylthiazole kinase-like sugar kinase family protein